LQTPKKEKFPILAAALPDTSKNSECMVSTEAKNIHSSLSKQPAKMFCIIWLPEAALPTIKGGLVL